jgi:hypothetical protein
MSQHANYELYTVNSSTRLALTLLKAGVLFIDDKDLALATNDLAIL